VAENSPLPAVEIALRTDPGRDPDKQVNEDSAIHVETRLGMLCVVCDGMGGHAGGREASELAVKTIAEIVQAAPEKTSPRDALKVAIEEANRRIWTMPLPSGEGGGYRPGSTVVAILAHAGGADVAHVGDSRIYLVHAGAITQVTKDHSMVQEMVDRNIIRAEDAAKHPDANKIMRALGIAKDVEVDVRPEAIGFVTGDIFVLCSDGLSDLVGPAEILDVASRPPPQAAGQLVDLANARGGHDNITAMVVRMKSAAAVTSTATIVKTMQFTAHDVVPPPEQGSGPRGTVMAAPASPHDSGAPHPPHPPAAGTVPLAPAGRMPPSDPRAVTGGRHEAPHLSSPGPAPHPHGRQRAPDSGRQGPSRASLAIGLVLAVVAIGLIAVLLWIANHPAHKTVRVIDDVPREAAAPELPDEDASTEITPAPPLAATPSATASGKPKWWLDPDAGPPTGEPRDCALARWGKLHGKPAGEVAALEAKCRAAGGSP